VSSRAFVRRRIDVIVALGGIALLALCALVVRDGGVGRSEETVFEAVNHLPSSLEPVMHAAQFLGVVVIGPIVAIIALVLRRWRLAAAAVIITIGKLAAEQLVWQIVQRDRPGTTEPNAIVRGGTPTTGLSFVSGHVVITTALAWALTPYLRGRWKVAPWVVVALVAFARIYLGAHNPLDVLGGLALGFAIGAITNLLVAVPEHTQRPGPAAPAVRAG
jgi:membrane-associated phospholipid phosphatase